MITCTDICGSVIIIHNALMSQQASVFQSMHMGDTKGIGIVRFRKKNHLTSPVLVCRSCLRRFAHIAAELKVFDLNQEFMSDRESATE